MPPETMAFLVEGVFCACDTRISKIHQNVLHVATDTQANTYIQKRAFERMPINKALAVVANICTQLVVNVSIIHTKLPIFII